MTVPGEVISKYEILQRLSQLELRLEGLEDKLVQIVDEKVNLEANRINEKISSVERHFDDVSNEKGNVKLILKKHDRMDRKKAI